MLCWGGGGGGGGGLGTSASNVLIQKCFNFLELGMYINFWFPPTLVSKPKSET